MTTKKTNISSSNSGTSDNLTDSKYESSHDRIEESSQEKNIFTYLDYLNKEQSDINTKIEKSAKELEKLKSDLKNQSTRNIEVIGIFASVLALLIINVNIVISANTLLSSILLIIGLTSSVAIFAVLIHFFFNNKEEKRLGFNFWIPSSIIVLLVILGILVETNIVKIKYSTDNNKHKEESGFVINNLIHGSKSNINVEKESVSAVLNQDIIIHQDTIKKINNR